MPKLIWHFFDNLGAFQFEAAIVLHEFSYYVEVYFIYGRFSETIQLTTL